MISITNPGTPTNQTRARVRERPAGDFRQTAASAGTLNLGTRRACSRRLDLDGLARPGRRPDISAYEVPPPPPPPGGGDPEHHAARGQEEEVQEGRS